MSTYWPQAVLDELDDPGERDRLATDLSESRIDPHDNTLDLFTATVRAGATVSRYLIQAALRIRSSDPAIRLGFTMNRLWDEPIAETSRQSTVAAWLDHSFVTLAAFAPRSPDTRAPEHVTAASLLDELPELAGSAALRIRRLTDTGRGLAVAAGYDSATAAVRARRPWAEIEALNSVGTIAGDLALILMVGQSVGLKRLENVAQGAPGMRDALAWREAEMASITHGVRTDPDYSASPQSADRSPLDAMQFFETAAATRDQDSGGQILVWYGTDRAPAPNGKDAGYSNAPSDPRTLYLGRCVVNIPKSHRFGTVRNSWWDRLVRLRGDGKLEVRGVMPFAEAEQFVSTIDEALGDAAPEERTGVLYVHGYNTSFEQAAIRAAQLGFDLNVPGITAFYSWPSAARAAKYTRDADNVEASEPCLAEFIEILANRTSITRLNLIVHSMGNRLVARTLRSMAPQLQASNVRLGTVVLAAPDINVALFKNLAAAYPLVAADTTMYVSRGDHALGLSKRVWDSPRAGFTPPVTVVPGVDTIDVTDVDVSRIGHGYYAAAEPVLYDILQLFGGLSLPAKRPRLAPVTEAVGSYWRLTP